MKLKLQQGQVWKNGEEYLRIVGLERLEVKYKTVRNLAEREGTHHHVTKKEFCRLIKTATLLSPEEVKKQQVPANAAPDPQTATAPDTDPTDSTSSAR